MHKVEYQNNVANKRTKIYTKKHHDTIENLEKLLEKGVPDITMSEIASRLKISLRTLYEIAPSKDQLILMTMDKILIRLGKQALDSVSNIQSPIEKLEQYLFMVNQAVGPKFNTFLKDIEKINGSQKMADYHENFISNYTQKLLNDAIELNEIKNIDTKAFSILLGGIGREFLKEKNRCLISTSPEESANSITSIILNGIKLNG
ncbi:MAG: TetR family transcriptional regulator [Gammaproteobacteria bacterium]|nr:TetR family transcriptional regulator [Gammaproteobacteria bacterium]